MATHSSVLARRIPGTGEPGGACNAGDPDSIPGLGRSPGEGTGYPLQYSWASLVAQLVKNPPAMWETWVGYIQAGGGGLVAKSCPTLATP